MSSNIDTAVPPLGNATTAGVRNNFAQAKTEIEALQQQIGFADYNDLLTATTPISVSANTLTKLTNDTLGPNTKTDALPILVDSLWNAVTNQLDLTDLTVNTMVEFRGDIQVTTTAANQTVRVELALAIGNAIAFSLPSNTIQYKSAGAQRIIAQIPFYIGSTPVRTNPGEVRIFSDAACTVRVNGWYIRVIKYLAD